MLMFYIIFEYMVLFIFILISVSFFTLFERKILSYIQYRKGPNKVGVGGLFQAFSDGIKLFTNELVILYQWNFFIYYLSPLFMFIISMMLWLVYPWVMNLLSINNLMMLLFCLLSINVYPLMFAGFSSNSIYSYLGSLRSISQTISYEVSFFLLMFSLLILMEGLNLYLFSYYNLIHLFYMFPLLMIMYVSILAELNRTPFDFSEGESELISGYNIEYMSGGFALIFLGEYSNMMFMSIFFIIMGVTNNWLLMFLLFLFMLYLLVMIRALLPRLRYDKLMYLVWLNYLPISLNYLLYIMMIKYYLIFWLW